MYTLVHMRLAARECIPRYALCALRPPSPPPPHPPHRPDRHRESELAGDNRVRFAPIELLAAVRNATRDIAAQA